MHGCAQPPPPLKPVFDRLLAAWGPQHWWPARTRVEICVGAILTQNTAWRQVELALANLRKAGALDPAVLHAASAAQVAEWIRPAGCPNVKAKRLKAFAATVAGPFAGRLGRLLALPIDRLRPTLLAIHGIGPETADCIVLYAARQPVFVIDAYTRRMLSRHGWAEPREAYDALADRFVRALGRDERLFNEYHALIVKLGKEHCGSRPRCAGCPLESLLPPGGPRHA